MNQKLHKARRSTVLVMYEPLKVWSFPVQADAAESNPAAPPQNMLPYEIFARMSRSYHAYYRLLELKGSKTRSSGMILTMVPPGPQ